MTTPKDELDGADVERFEDETEPAPPAGFEDRMLARLASAAEARHDAGLEAAADALRGSRIRAEVRSPLRAPVTWLFALGMAAAAALVTFAVLSPDAGSPPDEPPYTFVRPGGPGPAPNVDIALDARGRLAAVSPPDGTGERLVFRAGRVIRIEHLRGGQLDGVTVDFDADGGVVAIRTWVAGQQRGPWIELDGHGGVKAQGTAP